MKRYPSLFVAIGIFLVAVVLPAGIGIAQNSSVDDSSLRLRLEANARQYPISLSDEAKQALAAKCFSLQERLRVLRNEIVAREEAREGGYRRIEARLSTLQKRFEAQAIDTSIIDLLLANYRKDLALYDNAVTQQGVALNDAVAMDCVNNTEQFRSQIEAVRAAHQRTIDEINKIDSYMRSEVSKSLDSLKEKATQ